MGRRGTALAALAAWAIIGALGGCQANFGADVRNQTPTPLWVQLYTKPNWGGGSATLDAQRRLGPGDRAFVGPVRAANKPGQVFLVVDSLPNPERPSTMDLAPGTTFVDVTLAGDGASGPLRLSEKPAPGEPASSVGGVVEPTGDPEPPEGE